MDVTIRGMTLTIRSVKPKAIDASRSVNPFSFFSIKTAFVIS